MANGVTPTGFIDFDTALALVNKETRKDARVDIAHLMRNINYLDTKHNFTIPLLKTVDGKIVQDNIVWVEIETEAQKWVLREAIVNKYKELSGKAIKLEEMGLNRITAVSDDASNTSGRPRVNKDSETKYDDPITQDTRIVEG